MDKKDERYDNDYFYIHKWLIKTYGKANHCDFCHNNAKRFEWALVKGCEYDYKRSNFIQLCASCHKKYDMTDEWKKHCSESQKILFKTGKRKPRMGMLNRFGGLHPKAKSVIDVKTGIVYNSLTEAAFENKIKKTTLSAMLVNQNSNKTNLRYYERRTD